MLIDPALTARDDLDLIPINDVEVGDILFYPGWVDGRVEHRPRFVKHIDDQYTENRVLYLAEHPEGTGYAAVCGREATVGRMHWYCTGCHVDHGADGCGYRESYLAAQVAG
jgi:hypothetical protein